MLAIGLLAIALGIAGVLSRAPLTAVASNSVTSVRPLVVATHPMRVCQGASAVPRGTSAIRLSLTANIGPRVSVSVVSGSREVAHGARASGWGADETVTVPIGPLPRDIFHAIVCTSVGPTGEGVVLDGEAVPSATSGRPPSVRLRMEYLRAGPVTWWALIPAIVSHLGFAHIADGTWLAVAVLCGMVALVAIVIWAMASDLVTPRTARKPTATSGAVQWMKRVPKAAWLCALVAFLNAACWSVLIPPFQAPDEPSHFAYSQQLAETGHLPTLHTAQFSQEENVVLQDMHQSLVRGHPEIIPIATPREETQLRNDLASHLRRVGPGAAGVATSEPPLYYLLETLPYKLGSSGTLLDQLTLMRLLSALTGALTALFAFLFVAEALPAVPRAWTVGGMATATAPLLGFMSGTINPDALLITVSAALFYCLARGFRRGLTRRLAIAIGVILAIGLLTKVNFVGLIPGTLLGLLALALRSARASRAASLRRAGIAIAIPAVPVCAYVMINLLSNHAGLGVVSRAFQGASERTGVVTHELSYIWQFYLPRLPGMTNYFPGLFTAQDVWLNRSIGLYGWLDTSFPTWVYTVALIPCTCIALLWMRAMLDARVSLRGRLLELFVYLVMAIGLMALVAAIGYLNRNSSGAGYAQPRYLLPLTPLLAALLALAARGAGRRWGPTAGAALVMLLLAHDVFSQLLVVSRFYT